MESKIYTWTELNNRLRSISDEAAALTFYRSLVETKASPRWCKRAYGRYRALRAAGERRALKTAGLSRRASAIRRGPGERSVS
jgi:hypothetical protein